LQSPRSIRSNIPKRRVSRNTAHSLPLPCVSVAPHGPRAFGQFLDDGDQKAGSNTRPASEKRTDPIRVFAVWVVMEFAIGAVPIEKNVPNNIRSGSTLSPCWGWQWESRLVTKEDLDFSGRPHWLVLYFLRVGIIGTNNYSNRIRHGRVPERRMAE